MSYRHSMICYTDGISCAAPVKWRGLDGLVSVYWQAEGQAGAHGYYLSPDPRIMFFFDDVSSHILISNRDDEMRQSGRPMMRALYVPAGVPMWSHFTGHYVFAHLDLHIHKDRMMRFLTPTVGASAALAALCRPVEIQDADAIHTLAGLLVGEVTQPSRHGVFAESLVGSIVTGLLDISHDGTGRASGGLTPAQMNRLAARLENAGDHRLTVAEMAATVGLSESWFAAMFKQTTGQTPLQWQMGQRISQAQKLLVETDLTVADVAAQIGFSDQAHLTRVFRQVAGETPAAWRRMQLVR
ncbi:helix-turn-helix transcriptional regulator [Paracoccus methylovorus]|uniref:Helix-turn-helix transcriptional regulator n=3 Tax=Paracoccus TaxID=265 RepID=A0ABX7JNY1_9RHOB|nr:AraC family transcriptional regulator [Paracoccus methylovorus]QRZ14679.1 helix-turn-helix transcriptional regulator [Paracoccus methylovorus]